MEYNICFLLQVSLVEEKNISKHHEFEEIKNIVTFCVYKFFSVYE